MKNKKDQYLVYLDNIFANLRLNIKLGNWKMADIALDGITRFTKDQKQIRAIHDGLDEIGKYNKLDGVNMSAMWEH